MGGHPGMSPKWPLNFPLNTIHGRVGAVRQAAGLAPPHPLIRLGERRHLRAVPRYRDSQADLASTVLLGGGTTLATSSGQRVGDGAARLLPYPPQCVLAVRPQQPRSPHPRGQKEDHVQRAGRAGLAGPPQLDGRGLIGPLRAIGMAAMGLSDWQFCSLSVP